MNYSGKFDAKVPVDDSGSNGHVHVDTFSAHATHAPADAIVVPDAHLLFNGDFKRSGVDLVLSKDDQELVLHDYFKGEKRAALASPDGAHLTGDIVNALTGHIELAQADGSASVGKVIGHVTKLVGTATCVRNGVSIVLNAGDNVEKGDVVQSGAASTLGITFIDGTVFGLSSNARMVLNEMVYDPNGSNNSSLLSLVAGTITFVAGETAKHGDMKIDTPVATMGIRGTAVLVEIDFDVPGQAGLPDAKFQVLVEPDGTTGSYILFDKTTLTPLAVVDKAGQQINISNGTLTLSSTGLSSEIQKLITDVFSIKFSDTNTKTFDHHTDTPIPDSLSPFKIGVITALPIVLQLPTPVNTAPLNSIVLPNPNVHINQAPTAVILNASGQAVTGFQITELPAVTHSSALDTASGKVSFVDINVGDDPTVSTKFASFTYQNAAHTNVTATLSAQQLADIVAVEAKLTVVPEPGNSYFGSATWTYGVPDGAFDFLARGETLTLTYDAFVDNNYLPSDLVTELKLTITITGTNDTPVITTGPQTIGFVGGKGTQGGDLAPSSATPGVNLIHPPGTLTYKESGTLTFTDPDLTDTHSIVSTGQTGDLTGASLSGTALDLATLESKFPGPFQIFENALSASIATDSTGTGTGTISWTFAELPAYVADFIPSGETLTLIYTLEVKDSQNATSTQTITVTIAGNDTPAVVWKDTTPAPPSGALWSDASNWSGGNAPTINDDTIIITNQLQPNFPTYPVVIDSAASAKSLAMNDVTGKAPVLDNNSTLTIAGGLTLNVDAIINNFGNISVGSLATLLSISSLADILDQSALNNSGAINLAQGGDFLDQSSITNTGTIEISGGTLDAEVAVANVGGVIQVDSGTQLKLNGAAINGGTITDNATIDVTANSSINGTIAGTPAVTTNALLNNGGVTIASGVTLTLDNVTVTGTTFTDTASGAILSVDATDTLTLSGVTVNGGTINDGTGTTTATAGTIEISGSSTISGANLNNGGVTIDSNQTLTFDNVTVTGTTFTDTAGGAIIQVDDGTTLILNGVTIDGGTVNDGTLVGGPVASTGLIDVTGNSTIDSNASLNNGYVTIESGMILTLDDVTVTGTTFTDTASGAILWVDTADTLTLDGVTINGGTVTDNGTVNVDAANKLKLNGVALSGGSITNAGTIEITANSSIENDSFGNSQLTVDSGLVLTLDGATITGGIVTDTGATLMVDSTTTLTLQGSVVVSGGTLANSGTVKIESSSGATLDGVTVTGSGVIQVDVGGGSPPAVTLVLDDGTSITDGTLSIGPVGTVDVEYGSNGPLHGATFDGVTVNNTNGGTFEVGETSASGTVVALLDDGTAINGGALTIGSFGALDIEYGSNGPSHGATFDGVTLNNTNGGTFEVGETSASAIVVALLDDGTTINGGALTIGRFGALDVEYGSNGPSHGATFDGVTLNNTNGGTFEVGETSASGIVVALLDDGTTINGGALTIGRFGTLDVEYGSNGPSHGATFDGATLNNKNGGTFEVGETSASGTVIALVDDGTTINGGALTIGRFGTLDVEYGLNGPSHGATFDGITLNNKNGGTFEVGETSASGTVVALLDDGTAINGGALTIGSFGALDIEYGSNGPSHGATFDGVTLNNTNGGTFEVGETSASGIVLALLDDGTTINGGALTIGRFGAVDVEYGSNAPSHGATFDGITLNNKNGGTFEVGETHASGTVIALFDDGATVNNGTLTVGSFGMVDVEYGSNGPSHGATFSDVTVNISSGGAFEVGETQASGTIVAILEGATSINNGTLTIGSAGALEVETPAGATLNDVQVTNYNSIEVVSGSVLTLDGGTSITNSGATITVDRGGRLVLNGATITGGTITDAGTIEITGTGSIDSNIFGNHQLTVDSGVILTLDGTTITGGIVTNNGTVNIDSGDTLTLRAGAAFNGGTVTNAGTLDIEASSGATLSGVNITGTGNMEIDLSAVASGLVLAGGATMTGGTLTVGSVGALEIGTTLGATLNHVSVINNDAIEILAGSILTLDLGTTIANAGETMAIDGHATLVLDDATIDGGSINDYNYFPDADDTIGVIDADDIRAGLIDVTGSSKIDSNAVLNKGDLTVESGATLTLDNVTVNGTTIIVTANGVIQTDSGTTQISGASIVNDGTLEVAGAGSTLVIDDNVSGTGSLKISGDATLEFVGHDYGERVTFLANSTGTLEIDTKIAPHGALIFGGEISGVTANNKIDLADLQYTSGASHGDIAVGSLVFNDMTIVIVTNTNTHQSVVLDVAGSHTTWSVTSDGHGGVDIIDPPADSSSLTISSGAMLDIGATSAATVSFLNDSGTNGTLAIDTPSGFTGLISGFTGDGTLAGSDQIDLKGINYGSGSFSESYNPTNDTLSVSDGANSTVLHFTGTYHAANFSFQSDGNGGTVVYDPPVSSNQPATGTIAASAPNQTLTGNAVSDTFAFNFAGVGNATVTNFHTEKDTLQLNSQLFANVQAALNATHDDGHGNTVIALDAHDTITLSGVVKAQLHASDFHFA